MSIVNGHFGGAIKFEPLIEVKISELLKGETPKEKYDFLILLLNKVKDLEAENKHLIAQAEKNNPF